MGVTVNWVVPRNVAGCEENMENNNNKYSNAMDHADNCKNAQSKNEKAQNAKNSQNKNQGGQNKNSQNKTN